jgi:plastocyanin
MIIPGAGSLMWSRRCFLAVLSLAAVPRPAGAASVTVEISQFKFVPADLEIAVGGTVTFVNLDLAPHTATGEGFDTGTLRQGERKEIAFPVAGTFPYYCRFHRHMTGRILIR